MKVLTFDRITPEVIEYGRSFGCDVSPGFEELAEYSLFDDTPQRVLVLLHDDRCVGIACCQLENKTLAKVPCRVYGAYGQGFFDYSKLYYVDDFGSELLREIVRDARSQRADVVFFSNTLMEDPSQLAGGAAWFKPTAIFNSEIEEKGFGPLLSKKSVKRHVNKCKRTFQYQVRHFTGDEIDQALIDEMGKLHIETRRFHGDASAFEQPQTAPRYLACLPRRVLTRVSVDDETLAFHYGMVSGDTMIWYAPVVNIKYLDYSPLEVLLYETVSYCDQNGLRVLDLGIGDEPYKERFSNSSRPVYEYLYPISLKGKLVQSLRSAKRKQGVGRAVSSVMGKVREGRTDPASAQIFYQLAKDFMPVSERVDIAVVENFAGYVDYCRKTNTPINRAAYQHFRSGRTFFASGADASCWAGPLAQASPAGSDRADGGSPGGQPLSDQPVGPLIQSLYSAGSLSQPLLASLVHAVAEHFAAPQVSVELSRDDKATQKLLVAAGARAQRFHE